MKKIILKVAMALSLGAFHADSFAQGWAKKFAQEQDYFLPAIVHQQSDQSLVVIGSNLATQQTIFKRFGADGQILGSTTYDSIWSPAYAVNTRDGGFGLTGFTYQFDSAGNYTATYAVRLTRLDDSGQQLWTRVVALPNATANQGNMSIDTTNDGGFVIAHKLDSATYIVYRTDSLGALVWQNTYPSNISGSNYLANLFSTNDGGLAFMVHSAVASQIYKADVSGILQWQHGVNNGNYLLVAQDGNLVAYGNSGARPSITKVDLNGNDLWSQLYPVLQDSASLNFLIERSDRNFEFYTSANVYHNATANVWVRNFYVGKLDTSGNVLNTTVLPTSNFGFDATILSGATPRTFIKTSDNGCFLAGSSNIGGGWGGFAWAIKTDSAGRVYPSSLSGVIFNDMNSNCLRDSGEQVLQTYISITSATDTFIVAANDSGYFSLGVNAGMYNILLDTISPYWTESSCNAASLNILPDTDTILAFGFNAVLPSSYLMLSSGTTANNIPLFALNSRAYSLQYRNLGTEPFIGHIEVQIDTNLVIDSTSIAWSVQNGNTYTFPVSPLGVMESATLKVYYHPANPQNLDLIDRTLCFNAHAYSDTVYNASPLWDRSNLVISATYNVQTDSVEFLLKNKGTGGMSSPQSLRVIEDNVILITTPVQLLPEQVFTQRVPANGSTWRAIIDQTPHNPYSRFVTAAVEGAGTNGLGEISTGFINQYPLNGFFGYDHTLCVPVVASYDPNHKYVVPEGAGVEHLVDTTTDLEYTITFQNTGSHQAYTVRIVDTLASYLNAVSIRAGVSSHNYEMNFLSKNVVEFVFNNINLPDSATDEAGSQGYVKFKIKQRANNEIGTIINNDVAIYFDYNEPVITNTATVKIGEAIISGVQNLYNENVEISAYPNPFTEQTTIKVAGENFSRLELNVFDVQGRNVRKMAVAHGNQFTLNRGELSNGMYIFEIRANDRTVIGTGRIAVK